MRKVFVSGCFDILHAGHAAFFEQARSLGGHLTVSVAADTVLMLHKGRKPSLPIENKIALIAALRSVDKVIPSSNIETPLDFRDSILEHGADILAVTEDDRRADAKREFCRENGIDFVVLPKATPAAPVSTTSILTQIKGQSRVPLRVDFAGAWLDVPKFARPQDGYVVNCSITPLVGLSDWPYRIRSGLGGSAAKAILQSQDGVDEELKAGVGWQDPAVIMETGLCVWRSGRKPILDLKVNPEWLSGLLLLAWTHPRPRSSNLVDIPRDYRGIAEASRDARDAVLRLDLQALGAAMRKKYALHLQEGMKPLPDLGAVAMKYCGSGHGGYALYLFDSPERRNAARSENTCAVEPYLREP